ncbi:MAG: GTP-binding protein, partial [Bacteroidota bacterium]
GWDDAFGDRKNEIVFIGQDMDEELIRSDLDTCLCTEDELATNFWVKGFEDHWPIQRY